MLPTRPSRQSDVDNNLAWLQRAARLNGKGPLLTALMVLCTGREQDRRQHILLTPGTLQEYGMNRVTAYRSLSLLEQAGLIRVQRRRGMSPLVSILNLNAEESCATAAST